MTLTTPRCWCGGFQAWEGFSVWWFLPDARSQFPCLVVGRQTFRWAGSSWWRCAFISAHLFSVTRMESKKSPLFRLKIGTSAVSCSAHSGLLHLCSGCSRGSSPACVPELPGRGRWVDARCQGRRARLRGVSTALRETWQEGPPPRPCSHTVEGAAQMPLPLPFP